MAFVYLGCDFGSSPVAESSSWFGNGYCNEWIGHRRHSITFHHDVVDFKSWRSVVCTIKKTHCCIDVLTQYAGHTELWGSLFWDSISLHAFWWRRNTHTRTKSNQLMMASNNPQQPNVALQTHSIGQWSRTSTFACGCLQAWFQSQVILYLTFIYQASITCSMKWSLMACIFTFSNMLHYIAYTTGQGFSSHDATVIMAILSTSSFVGRVFIGWVFTYYLSSVAYSDYDNRYMSDRIGRLNTHLLCLFVSAISCLLLWMFAHTYGTIMAFAVMFGFVGSSYYTVCK